MQIRKITLGGGENSPGINIPSVPSSMWRIARDLHSLLANSEENRVVFPEPPVTTFRRCKNLKDVLVRTRLTDNNNDKRGYSRCKKSRCPVYKFMSYSNSLHSGITNKEYKIYISLNCDLSHVVPSRVVLCLVFNVWVAQLRLLGQGLKIIRRVIVNYV